MQLVHEDGLTTDLFFLITAFILKKSAKTSKESFLQAHVNFFYSEIGTQERKEERYQKAESMVRCVT